MTATLTITKQDGTTFTRQQSPATPDGWLRKLLTTSERLILGFHPVREQWELVLWIPNTDPRTDEELLHYSSWAHPWLDHELTQVVPRSNVEVSGFSYPTEALA